MVIRMRMILSETRTTSNTFSHHSSASRIPTPPVPLSFPDQKSFEARISADYLLYAFSFPPSLLETAQVYSSPRHSLHHFIRFPPHRAHIECAKTEGLWAFAGFATRARPCSSTPPSLQAGDTTDYSMVAGTA